MKMNLSENSSRKEVLSYIKKYPCSFLRNFSDPTWAQSYIDEAAKISLREDSIAFLYYFSNNLWAQPYIDEAAKRAANKDPLYFLYNFSRKPWAQPYIDDAVMEFAKKDPEYFLKKLADKYPQGINWALFALRSKNVAE